MQETIQEKDIFRGYEITGWKFSPRIYKILGISAVFNLLFLFVFAQANLLTTKGCDSPFVGTVCQVLDTVYVGKTLFGADTSYEDFEVDPTVITEEDITFIDVSNVGPPLKYPEGYFLTANPEQFFLDENGEYKALSEMDPLANLTNPASPINPTNPTPFTPSTPSRSNGGITSKPQSLPDPNEGAVSGTDPDSPFKIGGDDRKDPKPPGATRGGTPDGTQTAGNNPDKGNENNEDKQPELNSDPVEEIRTNKRPLKALGPAAQTVFNFDPNRADNKIEMKPFKVVLNGRLTKKMIEDENGERREVIGFDETKSKFVQIKQDEAGDPAMVELAKKAIMAVGDSGFLGYAYNLGLEEMKITLTQVGDKIVVNVESLQETEQRAKTLASGLNGLLAGAKLRKFEEGSNEKILLDNATKTPPTHKGRKLILNFEIPVDQVENMIKKNLESEAEELKKKNADKPNSTAQTVNLNPQTGE